MKKRILILACVLVCSVMMVSLFTSCDSAVESKALVVVNNSGSPINHISIMQYVSGAKTFSGYNALDDGETIAVGESKTFHLAPYSAHEVYLNISNTDNSSSCYFTYTYLVNGKNETITVTFNTDSADEAITMTGSEVIVDYPC